MAAEPARNRLSIAHLMLWTLGSAIILACFRAMSSGGDAPSEVLRWQPFYHLGYSLTLGAQLGSVLLFSVRRARGQYGFPLQPGHWLLLIEGISAILMLSGYGAFLLLEYPDGQRLYLYFALQLPNLAACTIGYALAYSRIDQGSPWRYAIGICALAHAAQFCLFAISTLTLFASINGPTWYGIFDIPQNCLGITLVTAVLLASMADWRSHSQRDFLHWAGIAAFVGNVVLHVVYRMLVLGL